MAALSKKARELLESIAVAGDGGTYVARGKELTSLVKNKLVEINEDATDGDGNVAARLTAQGKEATSSMGQTQEQTSATTSAPAISAIVSGVEPPRRAAPTRNARYPFDQLEVGQSFFVPATDDMPKPAASLGGTVSGANKRYAEETGSVVVNRRGREVPELRYTRKFIVRSVEDGKPWGFEGVEGAAVFRES